MKKGIIYGLRCPLSSEIRYVGQTIIKLNRRLTQHKCDKRHNPYKINWINKLENLDILNELKIELLEECTVELLNEREKYWIEKIKNDGNILVNMTDGGDTNYVVNRDAIERMRQKLIGKFIGRKLSEKTKQISKGVILAQTEGRKNDIRTDEQKIKISEGLKQHFLKNSRPKKEKIIKERKKHIYTDEERLEKSKKMSGSNNSFYGKKHSVITKKKMSEIKKVKYIGENNPFYGKSHSDETKKKLSDETKDKLKKKIIMIDDDNNIYKEFLLESEINSFLNVKKYYNALRYHINKNRKYRGYFWKTTEIN